MRPLFFEKYDGALGVNSTEKQIQENNEQEYLTAHKSNDALKQAVE